MNGSGFRLTFIHWHNCRLGDTPAKVMDYSGKLSDIAYGTTAPYMRGRRHRGCEAAQPGIVCTSTSGVFAVDVDDPADFEALELPLTNESVISTRGDGWHHAFDARAHRDRWPRQKHIAGGDIKSNGFIPVPGSRHYSGEPYLPTGWTLNFPELDDDLAQALRDVPATVPGSRKECVGNHKVNGGDGRNASLIRIKGQCERDGLTEEHANRRVIAANMDFDDPLPMEELQATVLRHKEWGHWREAGDGAEDLSGRGAAELTLSPAPNCELPSSGACMTPEEINRKRKAEAVHVTSRHEKRREFSASDWHGSPAGCWNFYDLMMMKFEFGRDTSEIVAWIENRDPGHSYCRWLIRAGLLAVDDDRLVPLPDKRPGPCARPGHEDGCWCKNYMGWDKDWGDPTEGTTWSAEEGHDALLPHVMANIVAGIHESRAQLASHLQEKAHAEGRRGVSRAMVGNWLKQLLGYRREKIPGTKKNYMWVYHEEHAKIHIAREGFSYRRNHMWAYWPPTYAEGPDPARLAGAEGIWISTLIPSAVGSGSV